MVAALAQDGMEVQVDFKLCYKCKITKPVHQFAKDTRNKNLLQSKCKSCDAEYRKVNKEKIAKYKAVYHQDPKNDTKNKHAKYKKDNPHVCNASKAKRRAAKLNRTPKWLTELDLAHIQLFYEAADKLTIEIGIKFEVDHIIPLQGKIISGLHVPTNLQVITKAENEFKGNRYA